MTSCITCGMPLEGNHAKDRALELPEGPVCIYDTADGKVRSAEEIFDGGVHFFQTAVADGNRDLAERLTRKNMRALPYWQTRPFGKLEGPEASDEEFGAAMARIASHS